MKKNNIAILILSLIIALLISYIISDKLKTQEVENKSQEKEIISIEKTINLDYLDIYLTSDGLAYLAPYNPEKIDNLKIGSNLKDRLNTLYERAFYYDLFINNVKLKGFKVDLDAKITEIYQVKNNNNIYIVFLKENHTIGVFNYLEYCDDLNTLVVDNYRNLKNVQEIKNNQIKYLNGKSEKLIEK